MTSLHGIDVQLSGVEGHDAIGVGERYHQPLRQVFHKVLKDHPSIDSEIGLRLAVKALNDTAGPEGVVPSLLVFGSLLSFPALNMDVHVQKERMAALQTARQEMASIVANSEFKKLSAQSYHPHPGLNTARRLRACLPRTKDETQETW